MRRKRAKPAENHERWLVSYADFITLLFAFFVMLYANSEVNKARARQISESFRQATESGKVGQAISKLFGGAPGANRELPAPLPVGEPPPATSLEGKPVELLPSMKLLSEELKAEIEAGRLEVHLEKRGLVISLRERTFFPSGGDTIEPLTYPTLEKIATTLRELPNPMRLEGHTDSIPIHTSRFKSNWELSAARSIAMLELFEAKFGFNRGRLAIAGFADTSPVAVNETEEGRARNRRVDIVVLTESGMRNEPHQVTAGAEVSRERK
jgi:chemotaxis protein MotB